jgi:hypothetical protein
MKLRWLIIYSLVAIFAVAPGSAQVLVTGNTYHTPTTVNFALVEAKVPQPAFGEWIFSSYWYLNMGAAGSCSPPLTVLASVYSQAVCTSVWQYKGVEHLFYLSESVHASIDSEGRDINRLWVQHDVYQYHYCNGFRDGSFADFWFC